ncbi:MAG TPA: signal recognition particle-docking protein FtsY [Negativicutes bacterium]|nr:signal recognition particle-docking protein FtsY [Negativicutes bacterium]
MGLFDSLKSGLEKSRRSLAEKLSGLIQGSSALDDEFYDDLEATLIMSDTGASVARRLIESTRKAAAAKNLQKPAELLPVLEQEIAAMMSSAADKEIEISAKPHVILVVGVNGSGKTTSIGKLAHYYRGQGKKVLMAAADTFRAAAGEQLILWAQRTGADIVSHAEGSDPAAVVYDALSAAKARKTDVLIVDTAGRLHTKANLMEELKKIRRVIQRELPEAPQETLLVLDAVTGQNALLQAKIFNEVTELTGVILTKLEGTAKGGFAISIRTELGVPVRWVGLGEQQGDFAPFDAAAYAHALLNEK